MLFLFPLPSVGVSVWYELCNGTGTGYRSLNPDKAPWGVPPRQHSRALQEAVVRPWICHDGVIDCLEGCPVGNRTPSRLRACTGRGFRRMCRRPWPLERGKKWPLQTDVGTNNIARPTEYLQWRPARSSQPEQRPSRYRYFPRSMPPGGLDGTPKACTGAGRCSGWLVTTTFNQLGAQRVTARTLGKSFTPSGIQSSRRSEMLDVRRTYAMPFRATARAMSQRLMGQVMGCH